MVQTVLLDALEERFGPPRINRHILIEYGPGIPRLTKWNESTAWITLEERCRRDRLVYTFQLAHEPCTL